MSLQKYHNKVNVGLDKKQILFHIKKVSYIVNNLHLDYNTYPEFLNSLGYFFESLEVK